MDLVCVCVCVCVCARARTHKWEREVMGSDGKYLLT
jgi:hypothetical protein